MSVHATANVRCCVTGNPCGTDTWAVGFPCECASCTNWLAGTTRTPPREDYVRVCVERNGYAMEPALEWRYGSDSFVDLTRRMTEIASVVADENPKLAPPDVACLVGDAFRAEWPDRAYFVETWDNDLPGFGQVFQPCGVPRNRP